DLEPLHLVHAPFAPAAAAGLFQHLAASVAIGAWAFNHEQALLRAHLAMAPAQVAGPARGARFRARSAAGFASGGNFHLDLGRFAVEGVFQPDLHVVTQIGPPARPGALPAAAEGAAEDRFENIADIAEIGMLLPLAAHPLGKGLMPETVIGGAFLRVLQTVIGDADGLEPRLAVGTAGVAVGVILHRQLAIGGFDRPPIGVAADLQQFVEIRAHGENSLPARLSTAGA